MIIVLLLRSGGPVTDEDGPIRGTRVVTVVDGLVSAISFPIFVVIAGFGDKTGAVLPRSNNTTVLVAYSALECVVVVTAMVAAITYRPDRRYRRNYLLLALGVVLVASADRLVAYLRSVGEDGLELWGSVGFVFGPLLIACVLLPLAPVTVGRGRAVMDWVQLVMPYIGSSESRRSIFSICRWAAV